MAEPRTESDQPEVAYTETQFGIRVKGVVQPIAVGPAEAERYRAANVDIHARQRTVYRERVTEWEPLTTPPASTDGGA